MNFRKTRRLALSRLEDRTTPSVSVTLVSGTLTIRGDNLSNNLLVSEAAPGKFTVTNNTKTVGTFSFSNLNVLMGNGADTVELKVATALTGNVTIQTGNGTDSVTTANSTLGSRVGGDVLINLGLGGNRPGVNYDQDVSWENVNIGGNLTVLGPTGNGAELVSLEATRIGKSVSVTNIYQTGLGDPDDAARAVTVGADLSVNNVQKNTDSRTDTPFTFGGNGLTLNSGTAVNRHLNYTGGNGIDRVFLPAGTSGTPVTIGGNVTVNVGGGVNNSLVLGTGSVGADVGGNLTFYGGVGIDRFIMDSGSTVNGNVYLSLGEGNNQVFGDSIGLGVSGPFNPEGDATVGGSVTVLLGNGDNFIGTYGIDPSTLSVGGNLSIRVGNGNNTGGDALGPGDITLFNTALTVAGTAEYRAGTGTNNIDFSNLSTIGALRLIFSGGPTSLTFSQAGTYFGDVFIDFGTGFGPKNLAFVPPADLGGNVTILNYP
ncbi:MAG: hypothetical protein U0797_24020 [Gemmataceae bacterium]